MLRPHISNNLPIPRTVFVGRDVELARLREIVDEPGVRLVTIVGPGGVGKTRLAIELAATAEGHVDVVFVPMAEIREPHLAVTAIRDALFASAAPPSISDETFLSTLSDFEVMIVLDNLEQVIDAAPFVGRLLDAGPGIRILATSRSPLRIAGEREFALAPFSIPANDDHGADRAGVSDAVALFVERARAVEPAFALTSSNAADLGAICRTLDGLPLAIELAAARVKVLSPAAMLARLAEAPLRLGPGRRDAPPRQQSLANAIDWSYQLLTGSEKRLLRNASVFAGGFSLEAAEAICGVEDEEVSVLDGVASLVDHSLLRRTADDRFGMLGMIRSFALEWLEKSQEAAAVRDRHAAYFADLVGRIETPESGPPRSESLARIGAEIDNIRAALVWSSTTPDRAIFLRLVSLLGRFWLARGGLVEARVWTERALEEAGSADLAVRVSLFNNASWLASFQGDHQLAMARGEIALRLVEELGDAQKQISVINAHGGAALYRGDVARAISLWEDAVRRAEQNSQTLRTAGVVHNLALGYLYSGDAVKAKAANEKGKRLAEEIGDPEMVGLSALLQVEISLAEGHVQEAIETLERLIPFAQAETSESLIFDIAFVAGAVAAAVGRFESGALLIGPAHAMRAKLGFASVVAEEAIDRDRRVVMRVALGKKYSNEGWPKAPVSPRTMWSKSSGRSSHRSLASRRSRPGA